MVSATNCDKMTQFFKSFNPFKLLRSFRIVLCVQFILSTLLLLGFNRWLSQNVVWGIVSNLVKEEIVAQELGTPVAQPRVSLSHSQYDLTQSFVRQVAELGIRCEKGGQSNFGYQHSPSDEELSLAVRVCSNLTQEVLKHKSWDYITLVPEAKIQTSLMTVQNQGWTVIRIVEYKKNPTKNGVIVAIPNGAIEAYVSIIWEIRDKLLETFFPILIFCMVILGWLMTESLLSPLTKIKNRLLVYESKDLKESVEFKTGFSEFDDFVRVFNSLTERLSASFMQAGRFSADASHELRTPLTILRGFVERAIIDCEDGSFEQIRLSQMSDEIERLITITDKLLLLSKADAGSLSLKARRINLSDMVSQMVLDLETFQDDLEITSNIQRSVFWSCDPDLIWQLLNNLSSNAVNYNTQQGWIHIELHVHRTVLTLSFTNPCADLSDDVLEKAFERFYRGSGEHSRSTDGHGLGLSLCKEIIRLHHGAIQISKNDRQEVRVSIEVNLQLQPTLESVA